MLAAVLSLSVIIRVNDRLTVYSRADPRVGEIAPAPGHGRCQQRDRAIEVEAPQRQSAKDLDHHRDLDRHASGIPAPALTEVLNPVVSSSTITRRDPARRRRRRELQPQVRRGAGHLDGVRAGAREQQTIVTAARHAAIALTLCRFASRRSSADSWLGKRVRGGEGAVGRGRTRSAKACTRVELAGSRRELERSRGGRASVPWLTGDAGRCWASRSASPCSPRASGPSRSPPAS